MINREQLAICKARGHSIVGLPDPEWQQCDHCGLWMRSVVEEREDDPPENERSPLESLRKRSRKKAE